MSELRRRDLLRGLATAGLGAAAGAAGGWGVAQLTDVDPDPPAAAGIEPVDPHGRHQAGIVRPGTPQPHGLLAVLDLAGTPDRTSLVRLTRDLGERISALTGAASGDAVAAAQSEAGLFDGAGDLTVTVGLGPRLVSAIDPSLPGSEDLPEFASDAGLALERRGGDLLLAGYGSDPNATASAVTWLAASIAGARIRWSQRLFRGPSQGTITRNPLGFHDGVIVPRTETELNEHVWLPEGPLAGGAVCVIRRLRLDTSRFHGASRTEQEAVIGRRRADGAPLSGGGQRDEVDLLAKTPEGEYLTPARSHARAAHPSFTGSNLMLRRGYSFDDGTLPDGTRDAGLMFVCFQRELRTFVQTQHRLDETDDLMGFTTATASGTFLILPGFSRNRPLGAALS